MSTREKLEKLLRELEAVQARRNRLEARLKKVYGTIEQRCFERKVELSRAIKDTARQYVMESRPWLKKGAIVEYAGGYYVLNGEIQYLDDFPSLHVDAVITSAVVGGYKLTVAGHPRQYRVPLEARLCDVRPIPENDPIIRRYRQWQVEQALKGEKHES